MNVPEGNVFTPVCQSVHRGVYPSMHLGHMTNHHHTSSCIGADTQLVLGQQTGLHDGIGHTAHPPWADTPLADPHRQTPPPADRTPGQTPHLGRYHPWADTPRNDQCADGTHPTGMHSCLNLLLYNNRSESRLRCRRGAHWLDAHCASYISQ